MMQLLGLCLKTLAGGSSGLLIGGALLVTVTAGAYFKGRVDAGLKCETRKLEQRINVLEAEQEEFNRQAAVAERVQASAASQSMRDATELAKARRQVDDLEKALGDKPHNANCGDVLDGNTARKLRAIK